MANAEHRIGKRLHRLDLLMLLHLRTHGEDLIPPSQMRMLEFIEKNNGCTQAEVADAMQVSPASVAQSIKRMEASGFVTREVCKGNLRANSLRVTAEGSAAARNCRVVFDELESRMFRGFSSEEKQLTNDLITRLITNLEPDEVGSMNNAELSEFVNAESGKSRK
ncbi:MAG: MarR family transcriptional regulator [Clostridia bacterium]|nr:MarR family transcriptional regulator [Clostridia bacterium]